MLKYILNEGGEMSLFFVPPSQQQIFWHPSTNKNAFVESVGSSTTDQVTQENSCPPVH